jgi:hypothetical protein
MPESPIRASRKSDTDMLRPYGEARWPAPGAEGWMW